MQEKRNEQTTGTKTIKKIGKTTYEVIVHFNDKSSETMQDKLKRIMLREFRRKSDEKKDDFDLKVLDKWQQEKQRNLF